MDEDPTGQVARLFDAVSGVYDAVGVDFFEPIASGLVDALDPRPGERWLDVGCGRGAVVRQAATRLAGSGDVMGIDISAGMVDQARQDLVDLPNVEVRVGDASDPDDDLGTYDAISCSLVLFFLPDPAAAVASWHPRLRAGGRVGVTTFAGLDPGWAQVDSVFEPFLPPRMRDARTTGNAGPFGSDAGMEQLLESAGYTGVRTATGAVDVRFADADQWEAFTWSTGQRAMWLSIPEDQRGRVRDDARAILGTHAGPDGSVTFRQPVRHTLGITGRQA